MHTLPLFYLLFLLLFLFLFPTNSQAATTTVVWDMPMNPQTIESPATYSISFTPGPGYLYEIWAFTSKTAFDNCDFTGASPLCFTAPCTVTPNYFPSFPVYFGDKRTSGSCAGGLKLEVVVC